MEIVPSEKEINSYLEIEVVGPEPTFNSRYSNIRKLAKVRADQEIQVPFEIDISTMPDGKYFVIANMKKDFITLTSDRVDFTVDCPVRNIMLTSDIATLIAIALGILIVIYLVVRARRKRYFERGVGTLRQRVKRLGI